MLSGPCLRAAARGDWKTVFFLLQFKGVVDINAQDLSHPEGFRLLDYAQTEHLPPVLIQHLKQLGATPSYDIALFRFAARGDWDKVYALLHQYQIDVNLQNIMHPANWTLLDYAIDQEEIHVIHDLMINKNAKDSQTLTPMIKNFSKEIQQQAPLLQRPVALRAKFNPYYDNLLQKIKQSSVQSVNKPNSTCKSFHIARR